MRINCKQRGFTPFRDKRLSGKNLSLTGFTLIEVIIALVVLGVVMIPLGVMSIEYIRGVVYSRDLGVAQGLAKAEMAKVNNLAFGDATLADGYDNTTSSYEGYPYDLRRIVSYVAGWNNNLKQVEVKVYPLGSASGQLISLITYMADVSFGGGSGGGDVGGTEADSLVVSGGTISVNQLQNITLENTSSDSITITGVIISFTGSGGLKLKIITIDGAERWSGNASSGSTLTFSSNFTLSASTVYDNSGLFTFTSGKVLSSVTSLIFIMSDGSQTSSYSW